MAVSGEIIKFRKLVWKHYRIHGRHDLAWRKTSDPYRIMISEVMLQQTQVPRVIEKYQEFLDVFPTIESLAKSDLTSVLRVWSGMGYNRRGKFLRDAAITIIEKHNAQMPRDAISLRALPGIGSYTASAILIFAFNTLDTMIETNIRSAFIHFFCVKSDLMQKNISAKIQDRELLPLIAQAAEGQDPRTWHWALMDYGSYLKKLHPNPSRKSAHYTKQSKFEGSLRQVRGAILRELHGGSASVKSLPFEKERIESALSGLMRDGMIKKDKEKGKWRIK
jgi:A/G-specific adenine glycosylase